MQASRKNRFILSLSGLMLASSVLTSPAFAAETETNTAVPGSQQVYDQTGSYDSKSAAGPVSMVAACSVDFDNHNPSGAWLGSNDVLIIGDSQLYQHEASWSAQGISLAGYNDNRRIYAVGGIGYYNTTTDSCNLNYYKGVVENQWGLPGGSPAAVLVIGSGNDADRYADSGTRQGVVNNVRAVISNLKSRYPSARIVMTDPISARTGVAGVTTNAPNSNRIVWGEVLMNLARENGATFISTRYWASEYGVSSNIANYRIAWWGQDDRHFSQAGHDIIAPRFRDSWVQAMKGITLFGGIGQYAASHGGTARFGVPVTNEFALAGGGAAQQFSNDVSIYWTPAGRAHSVFFRNGIGAAFRSAGYENAHGYPQFDEVGIPGGAMQKFDKAGKGTYAYYWSAATGTHVVWEAGAIGAKFTREGGTTGKYGFPKGEEASYKYGARQNFLNQGTGKNYSMLWSAQTDAHAMVDDGAIDSKWTSLGEADVLGFPVTDEIVESGAVVQYFRASNGAETGIWYHPQFGTHAMNSKGALYWYWRNHGAYAGLGYPTSDESIQQDGSVTISFSSGAQLRWTSQDGVVRVK